MLITRIFTIGPSIPVSGCYYMWDLKRWAPNNEKKRLWWTTDGKRYVICSHPTSSSTHTPWEALNHHEQLPRSISLLSFIHSVERQPETDGCRVKVWSTSIGDLLGGQRPRRWLILAAGIKPQPWWVIPSESVDPVTSRFLARFFFFFVFAEETALREHSFCI